MYNHLIFLFFFFNDTATTEIYTLSLHDALPIYLRRSVERPHHADPSHRTHTRGVGQTYRSRACCAVRRTSSASRSEEHTSELQSRQYLVCRLLLEKKKKKNNTLVYLLIVSHYYC